MSIVSKSIVGAQDNSDFGKERSISLGTIKFSTFYHPHVTNFIKELNWKGISQLLTTDQQSYKDDTPTIFYTQYAPTPNVDSNYPQEIVDFDPHGAYSSYNWELFFHVPLFIANSLTNNQQFEAAQKWLHYIFNPTNIQLSPSHLNEIHIPIDSAHSASSGINFDPNSIIILKDTTITWQNDDFDSHQITSGLPTDGSTGTVFSSGLIGPHKSFSFTFADVGVFNYFDSVHPWMKGVITVIDKSVSYWNFVPLRQTTEEKLLDMLEHLGTGINLQSVKDWQQKPFDPDVIAKTRFTAYQKNVVMKYIENLIKWGDQLFGQNTRETINAATLLYVLASEILGPRPKQNQTPGKIQPATFSSLKAAKLDPLSNALVDLENQFPFSYVNAPVGTGSASNASNSLGKVLYFCLVQNNKLLGYWDTVADRLFKIRNCMNIEGVVQQLPLYPTPIDPGLLVQAAAMGVDLSSVISDINATTPYYRFTYVLQKALDLCNDLKALGTALLSAIEKKDAEGLALLRSTHEIAVLNAVLLVKQQQVEEANHALAGMQKSRLVTQTRFDFYNTIPDRIPEENQQISELNTAQHWQIASQAAALLSGIMFMIPDADAGASGVASPVVTFTIGGTNFGLASKVAGEILQLISSIHSHNATMAGITGGWTRRSAEWKLQKDLAQKELDQIDEQILAATIRKDISQKDLDNQNLQIANANTVDTYMRSKFSNQDLYDWLTSQVSAVYFQTYQLAYDLAKRAEMAYRFERGLTTSNFIQFGYWDSLKKGLLAGEQLQLGLKQMEKAYMDKNKREYEITKQISLVMLDPLAFIALKETGHCYMTLPESLFDMDYPGHFMRRIKSVGLTIPCVAGPYTSINCTLTLLKNKVRVDNDAQVDYVEQDSDERFVYNFGALQSIATSTAQNDSGMFELNFHDERYLPFEGSGIVSEWQIDLPPECNAIDMETVSDVIIKLQYTARDGGDALKAKAFQAIVLPTTTQQENSNSMSLPDQDNLLRLFSIKHEFANEWYEFLNPPDLQKGQTLSLLITQDRFPLQFRNKNITIGKIELFLTFKKESDTSDFRSGTPLPMAITTPDGTTLLKPVAKPGDVPLPTVLTSNTSFYNGVPYFETADADVLVGTSFDATNKWTISVSDDDLSKIKNTLTRKLANNNYRLRQDVIDNIMVVCHYSAKNAP